MNNSVTPLLVLQSSQEFFRCKSCKGEFLKGHDYNGLCHRCWRFGIGVETIEDCVVRVIDEFMDSDIEGWKKWTKESNAIDGLPEPHLRKFLALQKNYDDRIKRNLEEFDKTKKEKNHITK